MIQRLSLISMALVSALLLIKSFGVGISFAEGSVSSSAVTNVRLLNTPIVSPVAGNDSFEAQMRRAGWDTANPQNLQFHNVKMIIQRQELLRLEKVNIDAYRHNQRAVETSA